jgi:hypothetical protein
MSPDPTGRRPPPHRVGHADRVAGRHGVPAPDRRTHARTAAGARRRRTQTRDAAQPWAAWLALRGFLALLVLAAAAWSILLLTESRGGIWPIIALAAGSLSLVMIGLDVRARRRQRAAWRAQAVAAEQFDLPPPADPTDPAVPAVPVVPVVPDEPVQLSPLAASDGLDHEPSRSPQPELPRRRSHRK